MRKTSAFALYRKSFAYLGTAKKKYLLGVLLGSCELALLFAFPYVNQALIDMVTGERPGNILLTLLEMLGLFLLLVPPVILGRYMQTTAAEYGGAQLYKRLFRHVAHMPYSALTQFKTGDYITRLRDDANRTTGTFRSFAVQNLIRFGVVFPVTLVLLLVNDWHIALAGVAYGGINLALSLWLNPLAKSMERRAKQEIANSASFLVETLRGIPVVRVFVLHQVLAERYAKICDVIKDRRMKYQDIIGITYGVVDFFAQSAQAVGFILGILLARHSLTLGGAVFNATLMGMMADSVYRLSTFLLLTQSDLVAMERVHSLLEQPLEDLHCGKETVEIAGDTALELRSVCFSYDGEHNVVEGLDLALHRGEHLAIVGGSGGGKSTVIKLIEGFYPPTAGEIRYFGQTELSLAAVRSLFAYVPQECTLFDGTIGENLLMARPDAAQEEIEAAAKAAGIHDFILSLPHGYDTPVGEWGSQLSGGQRQRVAIARSLLKDAPILLLDEATAALDSATEKEVQACLDQVSAGMTTITVAHRLSTIANADRILVMEDGKVVEEGNFPQLMALGGRFKEIYEGQQEEERQRLVSDLGQKPLDLDGRPSIL